jgi:hypothetical protein
LLPEIPSLLRRQEPKFVEQLREQVGGSPETANWARKVRFLCASLLAPFVDNGYVINNHGAGEIAGSTRGLRC